jgi:hypothetical protein
MVVEIPLFNDPSYEIRIAIDGVDYTLEFNYNQLLSRFYLSVFDLQGSPIVQGVKCVCNTDLLRMVRYDVRCPTGTLMFQDSTGYPEAPPELGEMGIRVKLFYYTVDELTTP